MQPVTHNEWGFLRRPALLAPAVGLISYIVADGNLSGEAFTAEGLIWFPFLLVVATLFSAIPLLVGAIILLSVLRWVPAGVSRLAVARISLGALVGGLVGWPFAQAMNWLLPPVNSAPRFDVMSLLVACAATGAFCATFYSTARVPAPTP